LIDRLVRLVPALSEREVSVGPSFDTIQEDLGSLAFFLLGTGLEIETSLAWADNDRVYAAGVKIDTTGRLHFDDEWVHRMFSVRQAFAGYSHYGYRQPKWSPEKVLMTLNPAAESSRRDQSPNGATDQYVTLDMAAAMVNRSKKTLERCLADPDSGMPPPDVEGGGGRPHEWRWSRLRPWLESTFERELPEVFPRHSDRH
jgi:hypothetical protein